MRVLTIGGTRFIGRAIVEDLLANGHEVVVCHRGQSKPEDMPEVEHILGDRLHLGDVRDQIEAARPDAVIDTCAFGAADTEAVLAAIPDGPRLLVLTSCDVYRAYTALHKGGVSDAVPCFEDSPVREERYPYRGMIEGMDDYEKLDVEERYLARRGTVLRLPMVYGERDYQRREWPVLRRVRAGRKQIPVGAGGFVSSRGYVRDIARGVRLATEKDEAAGEIFNLAERSSWPSLLYVRKIAEAAGADLETVTVPEAELPPDLGFTGDVAQHLMVDSSKARAVLGFTETDMDEALRTSVQWHLDNPPEGDDPGFDADDAALARSTKPDAK